MKRSLASASAQLSAVPDIDDSNLRCLDGLAKFLSLGGNTLPVKGHARFFTKDRSVVLLGEKLATKAFVLERSEDDSLIPKRTRIV
jgi:hypothetical protein